LTEPPASPITLTNGCRNDNYQLLDRWRAHCRGGYSGDTNFYGSTSAATTINVGGTGGAATTDYIGCEPDHSCPQWGADADSYCAVLDGRHGRWYGHFHDWWRHGGHRLGDRWSQRHGTATLTVSSATPALGFAAGSDTIKRRLWR